MNLQLVLQSIRQYKAFLIGYLILLIISFFLLYYNQHGDIIFWWADYRLTFFNYYFGFTDKLGEEYGYIIIGVYFLWVIPYRAIGVALSGIFVSMITQLAKAYFAAPRPKLLFSDQLDQLNLVEGWKMVSGYTSFPSGHTSAGFALAAFLCYYVPRKWILQLILLIAAASVGGARVYGANHFLVDVVFGSMIGLLVGYLTAHYTEKWLPEHWKTFRWMKK